MKTLLIVHHSMTGGALQMARAAQRGATLQSDVKVVSKAAKLADAADVLTASAYLFACPEYLAAMSGLMKDFFDRTYYAALDQVNGRPFALMICAGSDGRNAAQQIERIATGWRLKAIAPALIVCTSATTPETILHPKQIAAIDIKACEDMGATLAAGVGLGIF